MNFLIFIGLLLVLSILFEQDKRWKKAAVSCTSNTWVARTQRGVGLCAREMGEMKVNQTKKSFDKLLWVKDCEICESSSYSLVKSWPRHSVCLMVSRRQTNLGSHLSDEPGMIQRGAPLPVRAPQQACPLQARCAALLLPASNEIPGNYWSHTLFWVTGC